MTGLPAAYAALPQSVDLAARLLRRDMTPAERVLWRALRRRQFDGLYFRRQYPLGTYIVDFCCAAARLVVEVDGGIHAERAEYDQARSRQLETFGYRVLRFASDDVLKHLPTVVERIRVAALTAVDALPLDSGLDEGDNELT